LNAAVDHAHTCCRAAINVRHNAVRDRWQGFYKEAGFDAATEQFVPEVGPGTRVRSDIRARCGPARPTRYADVVITHPFTLIGITWVGHAHAAATEAAEADKYRTYAIRPGGTPIVIIPLAFETFGRWGPAAVKELRMLARARACRTDVAAALDPKAAYRGTLRRWRMEMSVLLQRCSAAVVGEAAAVPPQPEPAVPVHALLC